MAKYNVLDKDGNVILKIEADDATHAQKLVEEFKIEGAVKVEKHDD